MTAAAPPAAGAPGLRDRIRGPGIWLVVVAVVIGLAAVGGSGGSSGPPLAPNSTSPQGAKALALLVDQLGPGVDQAIDAPAPGTGGVALVLQDRLDPAGNRRLVDWVRAGGTLVTADPDQVLGFAPPARLPGPGGLVDVSGILDTDCSATVVAGVSSLEVTNAVALRPPPGATACYEVASNAAFMVIQPLGAGELVLLGGPDLWTNARLGHRDNSVLAANLLTSAPGRGRVHWIVGPRAGGGRKSLLALMSPRVKDGLLQLVVAVVLLALWRGRRLGRPVTETPAVELPGSELVVAVGNLLQQGGRRDDAATILRTTLRRSIVDQLGVPPSAGPDAMADVVAGRTGIERDMVLATIAGPVPAAEVDLVTLARQADTIRQELSRAR